MVRTDRPLAVVTGASTGIGYELARKCATEGFDLVIAADEPAIQRAADDCRAEGAMVDAVQADLATLAGVDQLYAELKGRPVAALLANAGRGLGHGFLDQNFNDIRHVVDTNVTGTIYLIHKVGKDMRRAVPAASSSPARLPDSFPAHIRPFTTPARRSWIHFPSRCAQS